MLKKIIIMLLCLVLLCCMAGCTSTEKAEPIPNEDVLIVGFSQLGSESGWRVGNSKDIISAAERAGIQLMYKNAEQKQENQIKAIRSFIAYQVDVIAFAPIVEDGWDNVLQEAKDAGIPVLLSDRYVQVADETLFAGYIGSNFLEEGRAAGRFLSKKTEARSKVRIVEITGTADSTPVKQRAIGFREILENDLRFEIVHSVSGDFLRSKGKECMENILAQTHNIDVLFSHNDAMTLGALEAIEAAGLIPGKDIIIITIDGEQGAIDLLKQGKINCVVECTPMLGDLMMDLAKKLASGEEIPRISHPDEQVFTEFDANLQSIPARGY